MRTIVKGKNYEVSEQVRDYASRKVGRLERLLDDRSDAAIELSLEQHPSAEDERVAILYRPRDGDYGLIEPMIGGGYTKGGPPHRSRAS